MARVEKSAFDGALLDRLLAGRGPKTVLQSDGLLGELEKALAERMLNERAHLSPEMALRIEKTFGVPVETLMRMQNSYDIAQARKREGEIKVAPFKGKRRDPQQPLP